MSGQGARRRRSAKRNPSKKVQVNTAWGRMPANEQAFYVWGETCTKNRYRRSPWLGPFSHVRIAIEAVWVSERNEGKEQCVAWFDQDVCLWRINHERASEDGYYEILFSLKEPDRPREEVIPKWQPDVNDE